jgi:RNA polymerase sigma-70 factor (TIGR02957 family)
VSSAIHMIHEPEAGVFQTDRPLLFSIAYRLLGSASDAEDVVQDAWLRYQGADTEAIRSPKAFATTIVTRLCLDRLKSARATREQYIGPWLPEPILTPEEAPDAMLQLSESLTLAFLVLLETLSPEERAVFVLKEVFEYGHAEIADMLEISATNSRQLFHRAKARIAEGRPRLANPPRAGREVAERFAKALREGDAGVLTGLLEERVGLWSDGGGKASASRRPLSGRDDVLKLLLGVHRTGVTTGVGLRARLEVTNVNHEPAVLFWVDDALDRVFVLSVDGGTIGSLRIVRNPDKLAYIAREMRAPHVRDRDGRLQVTTDSFEPSA